MSVQSGLLAQKYVVSRSLSSGSPAGFFPSDVGVVHSCSLSRDFGGQLGKYEYYLEERSCMNISGLYYSYYSKRRRRGFSLCDSRGERK